MKKPDKIIRMGAVWNRLAAWLNVPPATLKDWRSDPKAPARPLRRQWLAYRDRTKRVGGVVPPPADTGGANTMADVRLKDKKLELEIRILKAKAEAAERKVIPIGDVTGLLTHIGTYVRSQLYDALETEAPPRLLGKDAAGMRVTLREMADDICKGLQETIELWNRDELKRAKSAKKEAEENPPEE